MPPDPAPLGRRERKKARTRAALRGHAFRLFAEQGYQATTVDQIFGAAGVSESTFFRYFATKEDLVLGDDTDPFLVAAIQAQPSDLPAVAAVRASVGEVLRGVEAGQEVVQRQRIELILSVPQLRARFFDSLAGAIDTLAAAMAGRVGRPAADFQVRTVAGAVVGAMMAALQVLANDPAAELAPLIDAALATLESGLDL